MDPQPPPPSSTAVTDLLPPLPTANSKLRLMCSYGGHIVPRPQNKSLFYAGGETRIVAIDRRTTAASLSALVGHLSRTLFNNRPFHLKYQLPNEDLDSLISVTTDEDLQNMLEEHDHVSAMASPTPSRIRLFLFPVKPESLGSALLDPKSESWFSDALNNTRIVQRGQSADSGLGRELMALNIGGGPDSNVTLEAQGESLSNSGAGAGAGAGGGEGSNSGAESKETGGVPESLVLETSSSFGSTSSSTSMSNSPAIGVRCEDGGSGLLEKKIRVPSSASIESDYSVGSASNQPRTGIFQEPLIQVAAAVSPSYTVEMESSVSDPQCAIHVQGAVQLSGYQSYQQSDGKQPQYEIQYVQGGGRYMPQYPMPLSSYYPIYQVPVQQQPQSPYLLNQPCPVYLVPIRPNQNYSTPAQCSIIDNNANVATSRPPLHPQTMVQPPIAYKEVITAHQVPESATKAYQTVSAGVSIVGAPPTQVKQQLIEPSELHQPSQPVTAPSVATNNYVNELDEDLAYTQIYKTQPSGPGLTSQSMMKGVAVMLSESPIKQQSSIKHQATLHQQ